MGILIGSVMAVAVYGLYCCVRVGAEADRRMEELFKLWEQQKN